MMAPSHLTSGQVRRILRWVLSSTCHDYLEVTRACHPQRIKRELTKLGATKWHGDLMIESTAATIFIASHVSDNAQETDTPNPTPEPQG